MKPTNDLHRLIQSLSSAEKGYFKKYCQRNGDTSALKYLKLFDEIFKQPEYDEEKLKIKLADAKLVKNLSSEKNYLLHLILESLLVSGSNNNSFVELHTEYNKAKMLSVKSNVSLSQKHIEKVIARCRESESFNLWMMALDHELQIWQYSEKSARRNLDEIFNEMKLVESKLKIYIRAREIDFKITNYFHSMGIGRSDKQVKEYEQMFVESEQLLKNSTEAELSTYAKILIVNARVFYANSTDNIKLCIESLNELIILYESNKYILQERMSNYISALNNIILTYLYLGKYPEAKAELEKLDNLDPQNPNHLKAVFVCRNNTWFEYYEKTNDLEGAYRHTLNYRQGFETTKNLPLPLYLGQLHYYSFRACFYSKKFKEALYWINLLTNAESKNFKMEVQSIARISEIILHFELKNYDMLESLCASTERFLEKHDSLFEFEKTMLHFFRKDFDHTNIRQSFKKLLQNLSVLDNNLYEQRVETYFKFKNWVENKIA